MSLQISWHKNLYQHKIFFTWNPKWMLNRIKPSSNDLLWFNIYQWSIEINRFLPWIFMSIVYIYTYILYDNKKKIHLTSSLRNITFEINISYCSFLNSCLCVLCTCVNYHFSMKFIDDIELCWILYNINFSHLLTLRNSYPLMNMARLGVWFMTSCRYSYNRN